MELKCRKVCKVCPDRVPKLERELRAMKTSLKSVKSALLSCKALVAHGNQREVADVLEKFLLDAPAEDVGFRFGVIENLLKEVDDDKLTAAFGNALPGICDTVRRTLKDAGDISAAGLLVLRIGWDGWLAQETLDEVDSHLRRTGNWATLLPKAGVKGAASAKATPKPIDEPRAQPQPQPVRATAKVQRVSSLPTQEQVWRSDRMRRYKKRFNSRTTSGCARKTGRRVSDSSADSGIDSLGSLSPTEDSAERARAEEPRERLVFRINVRELTCRRVGPGERSFEDELARPSAKKSRSDLF